ncbi:MAG: hypothetical protein AWU57_190 [Marinobacter sp. T13-3]|nr:MAG: hypothetical protein AWU57_190 [Marinobacter sp. T13-3]
MTTISPQITYHIASILFWIAARESGYTKTLAQIITEPEMVVKTRYIKELFSRMPCTNDWPTETRVEVISAAMHYIKIAAKAGDRFLGTPRSDDYGHGRSEEARHEATAHLRHTIRTCKAIDPEAPMPRAGELCLRTPLPAMIFTTKDLGGEAFVITNTEKALGFHWPIIATAYSGHRTDNGVLMIMDPELHIPVPSQTVGAQWSRIIPNAVPFIDQVSIPAPAGQPFDIRATW